MNILGFDTSLNKTYLALSINNETFSKIIESDDKNYHSAYLIQEIITILTEHNLTPNDINLIATNIGPGSFTGIRVALTVARTYAQALNIDTVGINSLELISYTYGLPAITVLDARKNKAYVGNNNKVDLIDLENLPEFLMKQNCRIISDNKMYEYLALNNILSINFEKEYKNYGEILNQLATEKYMQCNYTKWHGLKPLYIQQPPIHQNNK